jgi:hypothetical protein
VKAELAEKLEELGETLIDMDPEAISDTQIQEVETLRYLIDF